MAELLEMRGIDKRFPGVHALKGVDFDVRAGEVHALIGENGAGKSTLIKILSGAYERDGGSCRIDGEDAGIAAPQDAIERGVAVVYQELTLVPDLSVAENVFFGRLPARRGRVQWKELYRDTRAFLERVGLDVDPATRLRHLGIASQQLVEIARALSCRARVLVLDEPTSSLSPAEIERLFALLRSLRAEGTGIVYVSHKLDEILGLSDRVTVLRDGALVSTEETAGLDEGRLVSLMVGRPLEDLFSRGHGPRPEVLLKVRGLSTDRVRELDFEVRAGEIVGFSGLMGAGRSEMARGVFGLDRRLGGEVSLGGRPLPPDAPQATRRMGLGLVPEDRRAEGIFPHLGVGDNMSIACLERFWRGARLDRESEGREVDRFIERLQIRTPGRRQSIAKLSGGNQQKALIARWLLKENLQVLFVDEPTRGIDVGAKAEIYALLDRLAGDGLGVVVISSEMPEILGLCDRIYVMRHGRIAAEFGREAATQEKLLQAAL